MHNIKLLKGDQKEDIIEFNSLVHHEDLRDTIDKLMYRNPFNSTRDFAYIEENNKIISMVGFLKHKQQFGVSQVSVGEVAFVGTDPSHRNKGLVKEIMNYWFEEAKKQNIPLCFLFGIANFYQQFGFEYAIPTHQYKYIVMDRKRLKAIKGSLKVENFEEEHIPSIALIYEKASKENFCSKVRSTDYFKYRIEATNKGKHHWYVVKQGEKIKGYAWLTLTDNELLLREAQIVDEEAGKSLAEFLYSLIENKNINELGYKTPLNNSFAKFLYKNGGRAASTNDIFPGTWGGMYKIILLQPALQALVSSFEGRIYSSRFYNYSGCINISTSIGAVAIKLLNGKVTIEEKAPASEDINIPINILSSIYTGYKDICYYKDEIDFKGKENYELLNILFPLGNPYVWDLEMSDEL